MEVSETVRYQDAQYDLRKKKLLKNKHPAKNIIILQHLALNSKEKMCYIIDNDII